MAKNNSRGRLLPLVAGLMATMFLIALAAGCGSEQATETATTQPADTGGRMQLTESTYDFGNLPVGEKVEHDFTITNNGTGPLELGQLQVKRLEGC